MFTLLVYILVNVVILILGIVVINRSSIDNGKKPLAYLIFFLVFLFINWIIIQGVVNTVVSKV